MTLSIELPPEVEAIYAAEAQARGVPLERHLRDLLIQGAPAKPVERPARPLHLPVMRGIVIGSLHRRDLYDDRA